jgi:hypothetical protein
VDAATLTPFINLNFVDLSLEKLIHRRTNPKKGLLSIRQSFLRDQRKLDRSSLPAVNQRVLAS